MKVNGFIINLFIKSELNVTLSFNNILFNKKLCFLDAVGVLKVTSKMHQLLVKQSQINVTLLT